MVGIETAAPIALEPTQSTARIERYHALLNSHDFHSFTLPLSQTQVATALAYLDQHYGRWDEDEPLAPWEYALPAIHHLYPEKRRFGFQAQFGPVKTTSRRLRAAMWIYFSLVAALVGLGVIFCLLDMR